MSRSAAGEVVGGIEWVIALITFLFIAAVIVTAIDTWETAKGGGSNGVGNGVGAEINNDINSGIGKLIGGTFDAILAKIRGALGVSDSDGNSSDNSRGLDVLKALNSDETGEVEYAGWLSNNPDASDTDKASMWSFLTGGLT